MTRSEQQYGGHFSFRDAAQPEVPAAMTDDVFTPLPDGLREALENMVGHHEAMRAEHKFHAHSGERCEIVLQARAALAQARPSPDRPPKPPGPGPNREMA